MKLAIALSAALVAAAPSRPVEKRAPSGWTDKGCVKDGSSRLLSTLAYWGPLNTPDYCAKLCGENQYKFAGVESESSVGERGSVQP